MPFFGGVVSSRVGMGEILESAKTGQGVYTEKINDSFEFKSPSDMSHRRGKAMAVIDYSQNFLAPPAMGQIHISSGQSEVSKDGFPKGHV